MGPVTGDKPVGTDGDGGPEDGLVLGRQADLRADSHAVFPGDHTGNLHEARQPLRPLLFKVSFGLLPNAGMSRQRRILRKDNDKLMRWAPGLGGRKQNVGIKKDDHGLPRSWREGIRDGLVVLHFEVRKSFIGISFDWKYHGRPDENPLVGIFQNHDAFALETEFIPQLLW